jgi:hypothetical protein
VDGIMDLRNINRLLEPCAVGALIEAKEMGIINEFNLNDIDNEECIATIKNKLSKIYAQEWKDVCSLIEKDIDK